MPQTPTPYRDIQALCDERFQNLEKQVDKMDLRLADGDKHFSRHDTEIATLSTDMKHLTDAIGRQTAAIWGACGTAIVILFGFFVWYVQHMKI